MDLIIATTVIKKSFSRAFFYKKMDKSEPFLKAVTCVKILSCQFSENDCQVRALLPLWKLYLNFFGTCVYRKLMSCEVVMLM